MKEIGRKIYYEKLTCNIIIDLGERQGDVIETTTEQDIQMYNALQAYTREAVGCIQLKYGQDKEKFGIYNYSIDKEKGSLVWGDLINPNTSVTQPTIEERLKNLEKQNAELKQQNLTLMDAVATMYEAVTGGK